MYQEAIDTCHWAQEKH